MAALQASQQAWQQALERVARAKRARADQQSQASREDAALAALRGDIAAGTLQQQVQRLRHAQERVAHADAERVEAELHLTHCLQAVESARQTFLARRAQREAAELFAEQARAAQRRMRASRTRVVEEEARERFASAKRRSDR